MEQELALLQNISDTLKDKPEASQRHLAKNAGISLGMMNAILGRFVERGWIMLKNVNGRKLAYAVTPEGVSELASRGRKFVIKTFELADRYSEIFCKKFTQEKLAGKTKVILYGKSHIKFLIEYACKQVGLEFEEKETFTSGIADVVCIAGELNDDEIQKNLIDEGCLNLVEMVQK